MLAADLAGPRRPRRPRRPLVLAAGVVLLTLVATACDDGTGPRLEAGNVDALIGATVVETDTGVVVNGEWRLRYPHNHSALWLDRFVHYEWGGFPEIGYPQNTRWSEAWALMLTHEKARVERNDSLIFSFIDHGDAAVEGVALDKLTELPGVGPGAPIGFENFIRYYALPYLQVVWLDGGADRLHHAAYFDALVRGDPVTLTTTGSADAAATTTPFTAFPLASLRAVESGEAVDLGAATAPTLATDRNLALTFDRPIDPDHAFLVLVPMPFQGQDAGALRAFLQPRAATDRLVIPAEVLRELVADATAGRVAYRLGILEIHVADDVFTGTLAGGQPFSLPFAVASETILHVWLEG